jgi:hypothetical protein
MNSNPNIPWTPKYKLQITSAFVTFSQKILKLSAGGGSLSRRNAWTQADNLVTSADYNESENFSGHQSYRI